MNVQDVLQREVDARHESAGIGHLAGSIGRDPQDGYFRLFPEPGNRRSYYLIRVQDVIADLIEWSPEERVHANLIGTPMYLVPLALGTVVQSVEVTVEKIGESIEACSALRPAETSQRGRCRPSSGCGHSPCCEESLGGFGRCRCSHCCVV